ncbi:MAG: alkaline phosphatase family protein [Actinomycetota bacterium]|nr:alkaline phosphatase family protein [Actinomycetota bacterium]
MADGRIEHVVLLMLENRSFDHMFGFLDHPGHDFPRLQVGDHPNRLNPADPASPATGVSADATYTLDVDPPHSHKSAMEQINLRMGRRAQMDGFLSAHVRKASGNEERPIVHWWRVAALALAVMGLLLSALRRLLGGRRRLWLSLYAALSGALSLALRRAKRSVDNPRATKVDAEVMRCMSPGSIPVLATLAKEFAVCTRWHCSVPGETWPNRNFVHAATSDQTVDIELGFYDSATIFDVLERHGASWRVYHDGRAHLWAFRNLWRGKRIARWEPMASFEEHVANGDLAAYSFIEPDHQGVDSNSQHPGNNKTGTGGVDFVRGEELTAHIYDVLERHPEVFAKTLFVVTYDEHGGLFDHEPPPLRVPAPAPMRKDPLSLGLLSRRAVSFFVERRSTRFGFRMLGPRVPAVVVSPLIPAGTVDDRLYEHSSVVATLRHLFAPGALPLTARDEWAATFDHLATLDEPRQAQDLPHVSPPVPAAPPPLAPPPPSGPMAPSSDEFARQLEVLAQGVSSELDAMNIPTVTVPDGRRPLSGTGAGAGDETVGRFRLAAEEARQGGG